MEKKQKILLVEDEETLLKLLTMELTKEGFSVAKARNGKEGIDVAFREHPDLILLDIIDAKMDGVVDDGRVAQKDEWGKTVPIIIPLKMTLFSPTPIPIGFINITC